MKEVLKRSDICNYTIFAEEGRLFGYYECGKGVALAQAQRRDELAGLRRNRYMELTADVEESVPSGVKGG